jgi:hypothetical protein
MTQQVLSGTSIIEIQFDSFFVRNDVQLLINQTVFYCFHQEVVKCLVSLSKGEYMVRVKHLPDSEQWFQQLPTLTVSDLPLIQSVAPSVIFNHTPTLLTITGTFTPYMVHTVQIDEWPLTPFFVNGTTI